MKEEQGWEGSGRVSDCNDDMPLSGALKGSLLDCSCVSAEGTVPSLSPSSAKHAIHPCSFGEHEALVLPRSEEMDPPGHPPVYGERHGNPDGKRYVDQSKQYLLDTPVFDDISVTFVMPCRLLAFREVLE